MVAAITSIAERFKDLRFSIATIQKKEITHEQVSTLFWLNASAGERNCISTNQLHQL
jgi:PST family polysaccharide transporter